jgi:hypothetical protein
MATSTYLSNPDVLIGAVNVSDQCTSVTLNYTVEALESTAFGGTARVYTAGLQSNELTLTMYASYAASESYATLSTLVGTQIATIIVSPAAPSTPGTYSATNPGFTISGGYLETLPVMNASMGELATMDIVIRGGTYTVDVS